MDLEALLRDHFTIAPDEGPSKVVPLDRLHGAVKPGMTLHVSTTHSVPYGHCFELIRRFRGQKPGFTIAALASGTNLQAVVGAGLAKRIITSYAGDGFPRPAPSPVFQRAVAQGALEMENWTVLTFTLRLMAAALGFEWLPTRSLQGSAMAEENRADFKVESGTGHVRALKPDLSLLHAYGADRAGNAFLMAPSIEGLWGCFASGRVLATVERVVSTRTLREWASRGGFVVPGALVEGVSEVPFGAHPGNVVGPDRTGYAEDHDFLAEMRRAGKTAEGLQKWLEEWVYGTDSGGYVAKLGAERVRLLQEKLKPDAWRRELEARRAVFDRPGTTPEEGMVVAAARLIARRVREGGMPLILAGQGASNLAAWLARRLVERQGGHVELLAEMGLYGYHPRPGLPFIFNLANHPTSKMLASSVEALGVLAPRGLAVLSGAQVDGRGNVNSTRVGKTFLVGSGGANDAASTCKEVVLLMPQDRNRLVSKVDYVTSPGARVSALVTTAALFEKGGDGLLRPAALLPGRTVEEVRKGTGWKFEAPSNLPTLPAAERWEIELLRAWDPEGYFLGE
ncbi:MAG: CoA-transferase [Halobacteria archaeon]